MRETKSVEPVVRSFVDAMVAAGPVDAPVDDWVRRISPTAHVSRFRRGDVLVEHHAVADEIHFLVEGQLTYRHLVTEGRGGEKVTSDRRPWMPVGWTSLDFRRYRVTAVAESDGRLLTMPLAALNEMEKDEPTLWACLSGFMFRTTVQSLWQARGTEVIASERGAGPRELTPAVGADPGSLLDMYQRSSSFSSLPPACRGWLAEHTEVYQADKGDIVMEEGELSDGLWLLQGGRVALRFATVTDEGEQTAVRYAVRPGTLLCWSAPMTQLAAPYEIEATRSSALAFVPRSALAELRSLQPAWLGAIFKQQLWQLRNYLISTRTQYNEIAEDGGIGSVNDLIEDSKPVLPVNSRLYGVPYLLKNRLTREEGFQRLYSAHFSGTESESVAASLAIDILRELERAHRFFEGLQSTYAAVVQSRESNAHSLRKLSSRHFRDALSHVPYVIKGLEHLPDDPNCIFIYNHMAYAEDSVLPNGFLFNPDSHFVSSMVLEPKYGDGIRIARSNASTEFWRADYYERLGHIPVATPESGWLDESAEEKQRRKLQFLADCEAVLASGRPFAIAPEGTITEEESVTERSPGSFKAGAFLMSGRFESRPSIVPIALANFDKPAYRAVFSCVIKPAFTMEERGVDVEDRSSLSEFLDSYRSEFRGHVEEAIDLAIDIQAPEADLTGLVTNLGRVDAVNEEFEHDVRSLELRAGTGGSSATTVFYGSSTFRLWDRMAEDLGIPDAVNLGFGGSTFEACRLYFERLVLPYRPNRLILYSGDNDISRGASADSVAAEFREFVGVVDTFLPRAECWFISIKPSPARQDRLADIQGANSQIAAEIEQLDHWFYVDWFPHMIDADGRPRPELFQPDQLHVNAAGYELLAGVLRNELS